MSTTRLRKTPKTPSVPYLPRRKLYAAIVMASQVAAAAQVFAAPEGGQVVGGQGVIEQSGLDTIIHQSTERMAIDWQRFDVAANERVEFIQPSASSLAINRVLSHKGSEILGRIDSNGQVMLVNPNGIIFGRDSVINVGGMIASGLHIDPTSFINGDYTLDSIEGTEGQVINYGIIQAATGGSVSLVGQQVINEGLISANLGAVNLAAGNEAVLTFDHAGLVGVRVTQAVLQDSLGVDAALINAGEIQAQGGRVLLTASVSQDIFSDAVNHQGLAHTSSVVMHEDGSFTLGDGADVVNSGAIDTSNAQGAAGDTVLLGEQVTHSGAISADTQTGQAGHIELHSRATTLLTGSAQVSAQASTQGQGGDIKLLGNRVGLMDVAQVNASGANGGGQVLVGGDYQGKNLAVRNAERTFVALDAALYSDALVEGQGGRVVVWGDDITRFYGNVYGRGAGTGAGGFAEVSGKAFLGFYGGADLGGLGGAGTLLLDPENITIDDFGNDSYEQNNAFDENENGNPVIKTDDLIDILNSNNNVILQARQDITVNSVINTNGNAQGDLTLEAGHNITIAANINTGSGDISFTAGTKNCGTSGCVELGDASKNFVLSSGIKLNTAGNINIVAADDITLDDNSAIGNNNRPNAISLRAGDTINVAGDLFANKNTNAANPTIFISSGDVALAGADGLTVAPGNLTDPAGGLTLSGIVNTQGGDVHLKAKPITTNGGAIVLSGTEDFLTNGGKFTVGSAGERAGSFTSTGRDIETRSANLGGDIAIYTARDAALGGLSFGGLDADGTANSDAQVGQVTVVAGDADTDTGNIILNGNYYYYSRLDNGGTNTSMTLNAGKDITLDGGVIIDNGGGNDFWDFNLDFTAGGNITVNDDSGRIWLSGGNAALNAGGDLTLKSGTPTDESGNVLNTQGGDITLAAGGALIITATTSGRGISTQGGDFTVTTSASFNSGEATIETFEANAQSATGNVSITSSGQVTLGAITTQTGAGNGHLLVTGKNTSGNNAISQANNTILTVGGNTRLVSGVDDADSTNDGDGQIILNGNNVFTGNIGIQSQGAGLVSINDTTAVALAASVVKGALTIASGGDVTQSGDSSGTVVVAGTTSITATGHAVTLNNGDNDFNTVNFAGDLASLHLVDKAGDLTVGSLSTKATGSRDAGNITIAVKDAAGTLKVDSLTADGFTSSTGSRRNGATIKLDAVKTITATGTLSAQGAQGNNSGDRSGGTGGSIILTASAGNLELAALTTRGGNAQGGNSNGGNAGGITVSANAGAGTITLNNDISTLGGSKAGSGTGGNSGPITFTGNTVLHSNLTLDAGANTRGDITFNGTIASQDGESNNLTLKGKALNLGGSLGTSVLRLGTVTLDATGAIDARNSDFFVASLVASALDFTAKTLDANGAGAAISVEAKAFQANDTPDIELRGDVKTTTGTATFTLNPNGQSGIQGSVKLTGASFLSSALTINGNTGSDTLTGLNVASDWTTTDENAGTIAAAGTTTPLITFTDFEKLVGGSEVDTFALGHNLTGTLGGGAGNDIFNIDVASIAGTVSGDAGNDVFHINVATSGVTLNGNSGADTFNVVTTGVVTATLSGGDDTDTLKGADKPNTWALGGATEKLNDTLSFSTIENINGHNKKDTFTITGTRVTPGAIDAGTGVANPADNQDSVTVDDHLTIDLTNNGTFALGVANAEAIESKNGGTLTINSDTTDTVAWVLSAAGDSFQENANAAIDFLGFTSLVGGAGIDNFTVSRSFSGSVSSGAGNDLFTFTNNAAIAGLIDAGTGSNTVDFSDTTTNTNPYTLRVTDSNTDSASTLTLKNVHNIKGNNVAGTTLTIDSATNNNWALTGVNSGTIHRGGSQFLTFTDLPILISGSGNDVFDFTSGGTTTGSINAAGGDDRVIITGDVSFDLSTGSFLVNGVAEAEIIQGDGAGMFSTTNETANTWSMGDFDGAGTVADGVDDGVLVASNGGSSATIKFVNFKNLTGGSGEDTFDFTANNNTGRVTGTIDGGITGTNTLKGRNAVNTWLMETATQGTLGTTTGGITTAYLHSFTNINHLLGGTAADTLVGANVANEWAIRATGIHSLSTGGVTLSLDKIETLQGGASADTFTVGAGAVTATIKGGANIVNMTDLDKVVAATQTNQWHTQGADFGTLNTSVAFSEIEVLEGKDGIDIFSFSGVKFSGEMDAGLGDDIVDVGANATIDFSSLSSVINGVKNAEVIKGNNTGSLTATAALAATKTWTVFDFDGDSNSSVVSDGENDGMVSNGTYSVKFVDFANLIGDEGVDEFDFSTSATGSIDNINGLGGADRIKGRNATNTWQMTLANEGKVGVTNGGLTTQYIDAFTNIESLLGGTAADTLVGADLVNNWDVNASGTHGLTTGGTRLAFSAVETLQGGSGADTFTIGAGTVNATLKGGGNTVGQDEVIAANQVNHWWINGVDSGELNDTVIFSQFEKVTGNENVDTFKFSGAAFTGVMDAKGNDDIVLVGANASIDFQSALSLYGVINAEIIGSDQANSTLSVSSATDNLWTIYDFDGDSNSTVISDGQNDGVISSGNQSVKFVNFANLIGGAGADTFDFSTENNSGKVTGTLDGGGGNAQDQIKGRNAANTWQLASATQGDVSVTVGGVTTHYINTFKNIESLFGGAATDTLRAANLVNTWNMSASGTHSLSAGGTTYHLSAMEILHGGSQADTFNLGLGTIAATIKGGANAGGVDEIVAANQTNYWNIQGADVGSLNTSLMFSEIESVIGNDGVDTFSFSGVNFAGNMDAKGDDDLVEVDENASIDLSQVSSVVNGVKNAEIIKGNNISSSLTVLNTTDNTWTIFDFDGDSNSAIISDGQNDGVVSNGVNSVKFVNFANLTGSSGADTFDFSSADNIGSITGTLDGGGSGRDLLKGRNAANNWVMASSTEGQVDAITGDVVTNYINAFINIENLLGGTGADTLVGANLTNDWSVNAGGAHILETDNVEFHFSAIETLQGGTGADTFTLGAGNVTAILKGGVNTLGVDEVHAANQINHWKIEGPDSGTLNANVIFSEIENLIGNDDVDTFSFSDATFAGSIDARGGDDLVEAGTHASIDFSQGDPLINGVINAEIIKGNNTSSTLTALNATTNLWAIFDFDGDSNSAMVSDGQNDGVVSSGNKNIKFVDFAALVGGSGDDTFDFTSTNNQGSISHSIDGGSGTDFIRGRDISNTWVMVSATEGHLSAHAEDGAQALYINSFKDIEQLFGGTATDEIIGANVENAWMVNANGEHALTAGMTTLTLSAMEILQGGASTDIFTVGAGAVTATLKGGDAIEGLTINDVVIAANQMNDWHIQDIHAGTLNNDLVFSEMESLVGNEEADTFRFSGAAFAGTIDAKGNDDTVLVDTNATIDLSQTDVLLNGVLHAEIIKGNNASTLTALGNTTNHWIISDFDNNSGSNVISDGQNDGVISSGANTVKFVDFSSLIGSAGADTFDFSSANNAGSITGILDGGKNDSEVINTLIGRNTANIWRMTSATEGNVSAVENDAATLYINTFTNIQQLLGGAGADELVATDLENTWTLNIGGIHSLAGQTAVLAAPDLAASEPIASEDDVPSIAETSIGFTGMEALQGGGATDTFHINGDFIGTIKGGEGADTFNISALVTSLLGEAGNDQFVFFDHGRFETASGDLGDDIADYSHLSTDEVISFDGVSVNRIESISRVVGNLTRAFTLEVTTSDLNTWRIYDFDGADAATSVDGANDGTVGGIEFVDFTHLTGGAGRDEFTVESTLTGNINGAAGNDLFNIVAGSVTGAVYGEAGDDEFVITLPTELMPGESQLFGGSASVASGNDTLIVQGGNTDVAVTHHSGIWDYSNPLGNHYAISFSSMGILADNAIADSLTVFDTQSVDQINLETDRYNFSAGANIGYSNKSNFIVDGAADDTVNIAGLVNTANSIKLIGATVVATETGSIQTGKLILDSTFMDSLNHSLSTNVESLSIQNARSSMRINEANDLTLEDFSFFAPDAAFDIALNGTLSSTSNLSFFGKFSANSASGSINLTGQNILSGLLTLSARDAINLTNNVTTNLGQINSRDLSIVSAGSINGDNAPLMITGNAVFELTGDSDLILSNANNDFGSVQVLSARSLTLNDSNNLVLSGIKADHDVNVTASGDIAMTALATAQSSAGSINYSANNIGVSQLIAEAQSVNLSALGYIYDTNGDAINVISNTFNANAINGIGIEGDAIDMNVNTISLLNKGALTLTDQKSIINIINEDGFTIDRLRNNGDIIVANKTGDITLGDGREDVFLLNEPDARLQGGTINAGLTAGTLTIEIPKGNFIVSGDVDKTNPDVVAKNMTFDFDARNSTVAQKSRPVVMHIPGIYSNDARYSTVRWYLRRPAFTEDTSVDTSFFDGLTAASDQLTKIEALNEIDPAVFTNVRNYVYDEVAIFMPLDQRYDRDDDQ